MQPQSLLIPAQTYQLSQGLTVVHQYLPSNPVTVADIWVKAGAIKEAPNWQGMAHFLEHMVFKGSPKIPAGLFDEIIEGKGGCSNAATSYDYVHFFLTIATEHLQETLPLLADILVNAKIAEEDFYREREVVIEELRSCHDDPDYIGFQVLSETLYQVHPYSKCILGTEDLLYQHSPQKMRCFHQTHYQPKNMTVVIVGGLCVDRAIELVDKSFQNFATPSECPNFTIQAEPPLVGIRRKEIKLPRISQTRLLMGWLGAGIEKIADSVGLDLISVILAATSSSRLVRNLREERQIVTDIHSSFSLQKDPGFLTIAAYLETEDLEEVEESIRQEIINLQENLVQPEELQKAQKLLYHDYIFSTESPEQLAGLYGYYQTIATLSTSQSYPAKIKQLTREDIQSIAQQYLSVNDYAVTIVKPL